jgi:hypothetical protein
VAIVISTTAAMIVTVLVFRLTATLRTHWRREAHPPAKAE